MGPAPWVFSKTVGVLSSKWRSQGIHTLPYLDDTLGGGLKNVARYDPRGVLYARDVMLRDLQQAGFLVAASKAKLTPCRVIPHLNGGWYATRGVSRSVGQVVGSKSFGATRVGSGCNFAESVGTDCW